ncbi:Aste57867_14393 [Aphanomyces stellatus]|uniref:Aste57867_14393 protein n=1 Tax=Aphanomyces stellatus TaxID=120398 RepID=A0A485L0J8_9STRA|nr:hypothetical protein As57867_014339 [Aphanomyces stellatus]VFT91215.1 Aste57867_14393 [Aphanomyces stellatus]
MNAVDEPNAYAELSAVAAAGKTTEEVEMKKALELVLEKRKQYQTKSAKRVAKEMEMQARSVERAVSTAARLSVPDLSTLGGSAALAPTKSKRKVLADFEAQPVVASDASSAVSTPPYFVGIVAVSTVFKHLPPLPEAMRAAATELHTVLCDVKLAGFLNQFCKLIVNPSLVEFQTELAAFAAGGVPPHSTFVLVVVSHGVRVVKDPHMGSYILFPESRVTSLEELVLTGLHKQQLAQAIDRIPAAHKLLLFDLCHTQNVIPDGQAPPTIKGRIHEDFSRKLLDELGMLETQRQVDLAKQVTAVQEREAKDKGLKKPPKSKPEPLVVNVPVVVLEACKPRTQTSIQLEGAREQCLFLRRLVDAFRGAAASPGARDAFNNWTEDDAKFPFLHARDVCAYVTSRVQFDAYRASCRVQDAVASKDILSLQFDEAASTANIEQTPQLFGSDHLDFYVGRVPCTYPSIVSSHDDVISRRYPVTVSGCRPAASRADVADARPRLNHDFVHDVGDATLVQIDPCRHTRPWLPAGKTGRRPRLPSTLRHPVYLSEVDHEDIWSLVATKAVFTFEQVHHDVIAPPTTMTAVGLVPDAGYCFRVRARNAGGWGPFSPASPPFRTLPISTSMAYATDGQAKPTPLHVVQWMTKYPDHGGVQRVGCDTLTRFARDGHTQCKSAAARHVLDAGGVDVALDAMKRYTEDVALQAAAATLLGSLAQHDDVKDAFAPAKKASAKILLDDVVAKFPATTFGAAHGTAAWARRMLTQPRRPRTLKANEAAMKLQGLFRARLARRRLRAMAAELFPATVDPTTGLVYYTNTRTGAASWTPPSRFLAA